MREDFREGLTSIMWSKNGICELELHTPVPSRLMLTSTFVSFVSLFTVAALTAKGNSSSRTQF